MIQINAQLKDRILFAFRDSDPIGIGFERKELDNFLSRFSIDRNIFNLIIEDFVERGLLTDITTNSNLFSAYFTGKLHEFAEFGGFTAQKDLIIDSIKKLTLELENLEKTLPKRLTAITNTIGLLNNFSSLVLRLGG